MNPALWALAALPWSLSSAAAPPAVSTSAFVSPSTAAYSAVSGEVGTIRVRRLNVFDPRVPGEDWWLFRLANRVHIPSKEYVIRREILLHPGDPWDSLRALESERNLRSSRFIRNAEVRPRPGPGGKVELDVASQDAWTLAPQLNAKTEGGQNYVDYGIEESNLLGLGKAVGFHHSVLGADRRNELRYRDPRLAGSRVDLSNLFSSTAFGDEIGVLAQRPFFSLDSPFGWSALWARIIQRDVLYQDAAQTTDFNQDFRSVASSFGLKVGGSEDLVHRVFIGTRYEKDRFEPLADTVPGTAPGGRELSGPELGYQLIEPRYVKETFINRMQRVEDFNLGNELSVRAGAMMRSWGSDADRWTLSAIDQQGIGLGGGRFLLAQAGVQGRLRHERLENSIFLGNLNLFWKSAWPWTQTWVAHAEANVTRNLDPENQLILGGNTGLRGYKNNSFTGARSALLNLEDRLFLVHEFLHLFYMGGAVFYEIGAVSPQGSGFAWNQLKSDAGLGLRFSPTRSSSGGVLRVDIAYALNSGPGPSRWVAGVRGGQAFNIFNSTNRGVMRSPASVLSDDSPGTRLSGQ